MSEKKKSQKPRKVSPHRSPKKEKLDYTAKIPKETVSLILEVLVSPHNDSLKRVYDDLDLDPKARKQAKHVRDYLLTVQKTKPGRFLHILLQYGLHHVIKSLDLKDADGIYDDIDYSPEALAAAAAAEEQRLSQSESSAEATSPPPFTPPRAPPRRYIASPPPPTPPTTSSSSVITSSTDTMAAANLLDRTDYHPNDTSKPAGEPYVFGNRFGRREGSKRVMHQDIMSNTVLAEDCTEENFDFQYIDNRTLSVKTKNGSQFQRRGNWVPAVMPDILADLQAGTPAVNQEERRDAMIATLTRARQADKKTHYLHFEHDLDITAKPTLTCVPNVPIRQDPVDPNSALLAIVHLAVFTVKFTDHVDLAVVDGLTTRMGGIVLGM